MACVVVPVTEAVITTIAQKVIEKKEKNTTNECAESGKIRFSTKLGWLNKMLWGGSALLVFEHIWHGEIVPFFPFLTGAMNGEDTAGMLQEMSTVGVGMSLLVTGVWALRLVYTAHMEAKARKSRVEEESKCTL